MVENSEDVFHFYITRSFSEGPLNESCELSHSALEKLHAFVISPFLTYSEDNLKWSGH